MAIRTAPKPATKQPASRAVPASEAKFDPKFDKKAYQRELMRKRRAGMVTVELPADVVAAWKATGAGWRGRMVSALRAVTP